MITKFFALFAIISITLSSGCGMQLTIPFKPLADREIDNLEQRGFTFVSAQNVKDMQSMTDVPTCREKRNVCGLQAGVRAGFLLKPQELFYRAADVEPNISYEKLIKEYPIMRATALPDQDLGLFPQTLAAFWNKSFNHHSAQAFGYETVDELIAKAKTELNAGRPVLLQVRISAPGYPMFLPDTHLGPRGFHNAHWIVLLGYSNDEWLIRDNGGLAGTLKGKDYLSPKLLTISNDSLKEIADLTTLSNDVKFYIDDPKLPVFLDDWDNSNNDEQLRIDFRQMRPFNLVAFAKK